MRAIACLVLVLALAGTAGASPEEAEPLFTRWTQQVIRRPGTLPGGAWSTGAGVSVDPGAEYVILGPGFGIGITDWLMVTASYHIPLRMPGDEGGSEYLQIGDGAFSAELRARIARSGRWQLTAGTLAGYNFSRRYNTPFGYGDTATPIAVPIRLQYNVSERFALFGSAHGVIDPNQDPLRATSRITLGTGIGLGYQPARTIYLEVSTNLASVGIDDYDSRVLFVNSLSLTAGLTYSPSARLDLILFAPAELTANTTSALAALLLVRYYGNSGDGSP